MNKPDNPDPSFTEVAFVNILVVVAAKPEAIREATATVVDLVNERTMRAFDIKFAGRASMGAIQTTLKTAKLSDVLSANDPVAAMPDDEFAKLFEGRELL